MSAVPRGLDLWPMSASQLNAVLAVEVRAYEFPWSRANFIDSLAVGHLARVLCDERGALLGYLLALAGFEELHLLNLTVHPDEQGKGHARFMLEWLVAEARRTSAHRIWLEVRQSNHRARAVYERFGFEPLGMRKSYYPAPMGRREDALVMSLRVDDPKRRTNDAVD